MISLKVQGEREVILYGVAIRSLLRSYAYVNLRYVFSVF